jgi:phosphohistidine phosphatase
VVRLWLLRHAKSSWDDEELPDIDRPLAPRGVRSAERMARYLDERSIRPELVLCSPALRARQTLEHVLGSLAQPDVRIEPDLYTFDAQPLFARLGSIPDAVVSAMVVGHNPAIHDLVVMLARAGDRLPDLTEKYPTGSLAELELDAASWSAVAPGGAVLTSFVTPRTLEA